MGAGFSDRLNSRAIEGSITSNHQLATFGTREGSIEGWEYVCCICIVYRFVNVFKVLGPALTTSSEDFDLLINAYHRTLIRQRHPDKAIYNEANKESFQDTQTAYGYETLRGLRQHKQYLNSQSKDTLAERGGGW